MKKLALKLDDLTVDSFETHAPLALRGTVLGNAGTDQVIVAATDGCTYADGGSNTCDRRCEPSIANCTTVDTIAIAPY
jgi:hypothetical protein